VEKAVERRKVKDFFCGRAVQKQTHQSTVYTDTTARQIEHKVFHRLMYS